MARWCMATGQPAQEWRVLTRYERDAFYDEARRIAEAINSRR